jgi:hypothetical protein
VIIMPGSSLLSGPFWLATAERAVKTFAQVEVAFLGADLVDAFSVHWTRAAGIGLGALVASVLTSVASAPVGPQGSPSLVPDPEA